MECVDGSTTRFTGNSTRLIDVTYDAGASAVSFETPSLPIKFTTAGNYTIQQVSNDCNFVFNCYDNNDSFTLGKTTGGKL